MDLTPMKMHEPQPLLVNVQTACAMLSISRASLYRLIASGELRAATIGGRMRRIAVADITEYADRMLGERSTASLFDPKLGPVAAIPHPGARGVRTRGNERQREAKSRHMSGRPTAAGAHRGGI